MHLKEREQESAEHSLVCVTGIIERILYESQETGFFVCRLRDESSHELIAAVGNLMAVSVGETVRIWGRWVDDKRFGRQLRIEKYDVLLPSTIQAIEKYLGSGLISGIGPTYAKRLVDRFGAETLRIIDEAPERLASVQGIGMKRARQIRQAWQKQRAIQAIMLFLQGHGIGVGQAVRIYKHYGDAAVAVLRENPYRLANEISGIGFKSADTIAMNLGIPKNSAQRIRAGLLHALQQAASEGHVFAPATELIERACSLLEVDASEAAEPLTALAANGFTVRENDAVYLKPLHSAETECAGLLRRLILTPRGEMTILADKAVEWVERTQSIQLSEEQRQAIRTAADTKVMIITGGPGTGKTTLIKSLVEIFQKKGLGVLLAAPTGRAAKRMEFATGRDARTIHRLLEYSPKNNDFLRNENNPLDTDLVIVDEVSMIDIQLMHSLLKAVPRHARLFLVGDIDQLPSVGPGNVLMDLIASQSVPVVWLKTVFRQAARSGIITNAHRINAGQYPEFNNDDFFLIERKDPEKAVETILELVTERMPRRFNLDPFRDIQVLAPMHRGDAGVESLNKALQQALNPEGEPVPRRSFRLGDKVMQLRNNYELDVYNGDVGIVTLVDEETQELHVQFEDRTVLYAFDELDDLTLAYAATVHKAQGSEYPAVVLAMLGQHYMMLQRNVLYTAITRGSRIVIIVGDPRAVGRAVHNTSVTRRHSRLAERLRGNNKTN